MPSQKSSLSREQQDSIKRLMQTGVESYKEKCMKGLVPLENAAALFGDKLEVFCMPRKPSDDENYMLVENQLNPCVIATRVVTHEGKPLFRSRDAKILIIEHMKENMLADDINALSWEIQYKSGEMSKKNFTALMGTIWVKDPDSDLDLDQVQREAAEAERDALDPEGYAAQNIDFDSNEPAPVTPTYPVGKAPDIELEPSVARAEGN